MYPKCPHCNVECRSFPSCRKMTLREISKEEVHYDRACLTVLSITEQMISTESEVHTYEG